MGSIFCKGSGDKVGVSRGFEDASSRRRRARWKTRNGATRVGGWGGGGGARETVESSFPAQ